MSISILSSSSMIVSRKPLYLSSCQALPWNPVSKFGFTKRNGQTSLRVSKHRSLVVYANVIPGPVPSLPPPSGGSGKSWILAIVVSVILPFFTHKWGPLWVLKNRVDNAVQMVENIVETVEKVAGEVDKIAEDIADDLPAGKLKDIMELIEHVAENTAKTADSLDNVIDKVQEAEEQVECIVVSAVTSKKQKDDAVQKLENIVDAVEKVAEQVDKTAEDIADDLPVGKIKDIFESIEDVAEKTAKTADSLDNIIDKVQEVEEQVDSVVNFKETN